ncbi:MAG: sigma-70 family RNA polymerase sigma factor [Planctomycetaceae bacterium]
MALTEIDRKLLARCLGREPGAWNDFVDRFMGLFVHVVQHVAYSRSVRLSPADQDDLCAEVFVRLVADDFAVLRRFRGNSSLATYLTIVARRIVVREIAKRRMAEALGHVNAHQTSLDEAHAQSVAPREQRIDSQDEVRGILEHLPPGDAEIVKQFHLEGKSYREISSKLGIPENSIGPTLSRARAKLRERENSSR